MRMTKLSAIVQWLLVAGAFLVAGAGLTGCRSHDDTSPIDRFIPSDRLSSQQVTAFTEDRRG